MYFLTPLKHVVQYIKKGGVNSSFIYIFACKFIKAYKYRPPYKVSKHNNSCFFIFRTMNVKKFTQKRLLLALFAYSLAININAVKVHINSGNPAFPFPQFMEYACGGNLGTKLAEGLTHAEMEQQIRDAYQLHANEFEYTGESWGGYKYIETSYKIPYDCTEGDGYGLLAAAYMGDAVTFNGYWMCTHDKRRNRAKKYTDCTTIGDGYQYGPFAISDDAGGGGNTAADGDVDVALALYVAYKQWGEFMRDQDGNIVEDACGNPISYKKELIEVVRGLVALSTRFWEETPYLRVSSGIIGLDGYPKEGDTWPEITDFHNDKNPLVFTASEPVYSITEGKELEIEDVKGKKLVPEFSGGNKGLFDYNAPAYYKEFHDLLISLSSELGISNEWEAEQFRRAEASSDWLMGQLIYKNEHSLPTAGQYTVNTDGSETSFELGDFGGFCAAWRSISNYIWHGNPEYTWNPVTHQVEAANNTAEYDAAVKYAKYLRDPVHWNDSLNSSCVNAGLIYSISDQKTIVHQIDPMTGAYIGNEVAYYTSGLGKATASFAAIGAQDYDLMGGLYNSVYSLWDLRGQTPEGEDVPKYMHGWFRQLGLLALTGNYTAPSSMEAGCNLRIYRSIKDSISSCRVGDTITYQLSYRNYGSKTATGTAVTEKVPNDFAIVEISDGGVFNKKDNTIKWNIGEVAGFKSDNIEGAALDPTAPNLSKTMGSVWYKCVVKPSAKGTYSTIATIQSEESKERCTDNYPNFITATMQRNTIDIVPNTISVAKTVDKDLLEKDDMVQFTVSFSNTDSLPFLTGGRPGVNFTAAGEKYSDNDYRIKYRLNNDAVEPYINNGNYRITYFSTTKDAILYTMLNEGILKNMQEISTSSIQFPNGIVGYQIQLPNYLSSNSVFQIWTFGNEFHSIKGEVPLRVIFSCHTDKYDPIDESMSWSKLETAKDNDLYYPVSPSYQSPEKIETIDKVINSSCEVSDKVTETILVEEYDGHTWRKILGSAPYNGIEVENVVVTDTIPLGFEFVSLLDSTNAVYTPAPKESAYAGVVTHKTDKLKIGDKGSFGYVCRFVGSSAESIKTSCHISDNIENVESAPIVMHVKELTSLEKTKSENKGPVNVYNPQGIMLKKQVDIEHATDGLRKGVYMVGKKKTIVTK